MFSLAAADLTVRACAGAPGDRRAAVAVAAWSDSYQLGTALVAGTAPAYPTWRQWVSRTKAAKITPTTPVATMRLSAPV